MRARWRLAARIARRDAARHRWRSALVVGLIMLPVGLLAGAVTLWATAQETPEQRATAVMGTSDAIVESPRGTETMTDVRDDLPHGARAVPVETSRPVGVLVGAERRDVNFTGALLTDPLLSGHLEIVAGRAPAGIDEAAVSVSLLADLEAEIGDELHLADLDGALVITGVVERPARLSADDVVVLPGTVPGRLDRRIWFVDAGTAGMGAVIEATGASTAADLQGSAPADPRAPVLTPRGVVGGPDDETLAMLAIFGGLALTEAAIVASAAFAVGVRRQLRTLGLVAAAGGTGRDLRRIVIAGGLALGAIGAVLGAALGVMAVTAMVPYLDDWLDRRVGALAVPWAPVAVSIVAGVVAALAAAAAPARTAGRVPVTFALAATRPVTRPSRRGVLAGIGVVLLGLSLIAFIVGGQQVRLSEIPVIATITFGAILVVLGFTFASPAMAGILGRLARYAPTGTRLALRDLARHRVRTGPAISAVMAALALPVAVGMFLASSEARANEHRIPMLAPEHVLVEAHPVVIEAHSTDGVVRPDPGRVDAVAEAVEASTRVTLTELRPGDSAPAPGGFVEVEAILERDLEGPGRRSSRLAAVDDVDAALAALGVEGDEREGARQTLDEGGVVIFGVEAVHQPTGVVRAGGEIAGRPAVAGVRAERYATLPAAITSAETADRLGLEPSQHVVLLATGDPPDEEARAAARAAAGNTGRPGPEGSPVGVDEDAALLRFHQSFEPVHDRGLRWITLGGAAAVAAGVVVVALALSAAEGRAERATLAAVGADRRMRRGFRAAQALALTLTAGVLAIPAGSLPTAVTLLARDPDYPLRLPWEAVAVALVGLPLVAWTAVRLLAREPELPGRAGPSNATAP